MKVKLQDSLAENAKLRTRLSVVEAKAWTVTRAEICEDLLRKFCPGKLSFQFDDFAECLNHVQKRTEEEVWASWQRCCAAARVGDVRVSEVIDKPTFLLIFGAAFPVASEEKVMREVQTCHNCRFFAMVSPFAWMFLASPSFTTTITVFLDVFSLPLPSLTIRVEGFWCPVKSVPGFQVPSIKSAVRQSTMSVSFQCPSVHVRQSAMPVSLRQSR